MPRLSIRVEDDLLRRIDRAAETLGRSRSDFVRMSLEVGVADGEQAAASLQSPVVRLLLRAMGSPAERERLDRVLGDVDVPGLEALAGGES